MAPVLSAGVVKHGNCNFEVTFSLVDNAAGTTQQWAGVKLHPASFGNPCKKNFWGFLPWNESCDPPGDILEAETIPLITDENAVTGHDVLTAVEMQDDSETDGNCRIYRLRWKAWYWGKANPHNPAEAKVKGPLKFKADAGETPTWAGTFTIRLCCTGSDGGCGLSCDVAR